MVLNKYTEPLSTYQTSMAPTTAQLQHLIQVLRKYPIVKIKVKVLVKCILELLVDPEHINEADQEEG